MKFHIRRRISSGIGNFLDLIVEYITVLKIIHGYFRYNQRIIVIDPSLIDKKGHHYSAALALKNEADSLKLGCQFIGNMRATQQIRAIPCLPYFIDSGYAHLPEGDEYSNLRVTFKSANRIYNALKRIPKFVFHRHDFIFFPAITPNQVLGVAQWIAGFDPNHCPKIGMCFMFQPDWDVSGEISEKVRHIYNAAFEILRNQPGKSIVFTCETKALAEEYQGLLELPVIAMPIPTIKHTIRDTLRNIKIKTKGDRTRVAVLGYTKREKGAHILSSIIEEVNHRSNGFEFVVQISGSDKKFNNSVKQNLAIIKNVKIIDGELSGEDHIREIANADIVLLPYDPTTYRTRGSGLFTEAKMIGIPVIAPSGTSMGDEVDRCGFGITFQKFSVPDIAEAILMAIRHHKELKDAAKRAAEKHQNSDSYLATLLARVPQIDC